MPTKRKTTTSSAVKRRYNAKTYRVFSASLRLDTDAELIEWIEKHRDSYSIADIMRAGLDALMRDEK